MAPFNLSDFAVKEIKIPQSELTPPKQENYLGKILAAHFFDFWSVFWISITTKFFFKAAISALMITPGLQDAWDLVDFTPMTFLSMLPIGFTYFFGSYFMNHGQTYGMKLMKTRVVMREHSFTEAFQWALRSLAVIGTFGLIARSFKDSCAAQDHLWRALVTSKDQTAPDVRTLETQKDVEETVYEEAA